MEGKAGCFSKETVAILATKMSGACWVVCVCVLEERLKVVGYVSVQVASATTGWSGERALNWELGIWLQLLAASVTSREILSK